MNNETLIPLLALLCDVGIFLVALTTLILHLT